MIKSLIQNLLTIINYLVAIALLLSIFTVLLLYTLGIPPVIERFASEFTGRKITIGDIKIEWADSARIQMHDFRMSNATWGTEPYMVKLNSLDVVLDLSALIQGDKVVQNITASGLDIFLERDEKGVGNWRFHDLTPSVQKGPLKHEPTERAGFPIIRDGIILDSMFRMKTSSGAMIQIDAHNLKFNSKDGRSPVLIVLEGAYNGKIAKMTMAGDSYAVLHDDETPYPVKFRLERNTGTLDFEGTMTDPVNMDGAQGLLTISAPDMGEILSMFGLNIQATFPLHLKTPMTRAGDRWFFKKLVGDLADTDFTGELILNEGSRTLPDAITGKFTFEKVDARKIIDGVSRLKRPSRRTDITSIPLQAPRNPGITVDVDLGANGIHYDNWIISNVGFHFKNDPGKISIESLKFSLAGGQILMRMHLDATRDLPQLTSKIDVEGVDAGRVLHLAKNIDTKNIIDGPVNARAILQMHGNNVGHAIRNSRGGVVAYMNEGHISKKFLELASIDLHLLLGGSDGQENMSCLLGVLTMRNGLGILSPLKLEAPSASLGGGGSINLLNKKIDVFMKPVEGTTGFWALDVPLRFSGEYSSIKIEPLFLDRYRLPESSAIRQIPPDLMPELRSVAMKSSCIK